MVTCTALALTLLAFGCDDDSSTSPDDALREAKTDLAGAIATAERAEPTGVVVEAEFEQRDDAAVYEVALLVGDEVREVFVNPADGKVIATEADPEDLEEARASAAVLGTAKIGMREAIAAAMRAADGSAFEIEVDADGFEVLVLGDGGAATVVELALDGAVVATRPHESGVEVEDEHEEDEEEDEEEEDEENEVEEASAG
jgi:uncharacterized membrane protein YkoI